MNKNICYFHKMTSLIQIFSEIPIREIKRINISIFGYARVVFVDLIKSPENFINLDEIL